MKILIYIFLAMLCMGCSSRVQSIRADYDHAVQKQATFDGDIVKPSFPGGENALIEYIVKNFHYPQTCEVFGGKVIVQFTVTRTGDVTDIKIVRSVHPEIDEEVVRVCKTFPRFIPGSYRGEVQDMPYILPITFNPQK